jgi:hypothetical protein
LNERLPGSTTVGADGIFFFSSVDWGSRWRQIDWLEADGYSFSFEVGLLSGLVFFLANGAGGFLRYVFFYYSWNTSSSFSPCTYTRHAFDWFLLLSLQIFTTGILIRCLER